MIRHLSTFALAAVVSACGGADQRSANATMPPGAGTLDIRIAAPVEPVTGENTFEVVVTDAGVPLTDADVSLELLMEAMPSMNMPEMKSTIPLSHQGEGRYRGTGTVSMAGAWDATVMVMRGDNHLGSETVTIIAK